MNNKEQILSLLDTHKYLRQEMIQQEMRQLKRTNQNILRIMATRDKVIKRFRLDSKEQYIYYLDKSLSAKWRHWLAILTGILNFADYFLSLQAFRAGMAEGNPVMDAILHTPIFPLYKLGAVTVFLWLLWRYRERVPRLRYYVWVPFMAYAMLTGWHVFLAATGY